MKRGIMRGMPTGLVNSAFRGAMSGLLLALGLWLAPRVFAIDPPTPTLPSARAVLERLLTNATNTQIQSLKQSYVWRRVSVVEELGDSGEVDERKEQVYQVVHIHGKPHSRLVSVNGKPIPASAEKQERERESKLRLENSGSGENRKRPDMRLTPELLARYVFVVRSREIWEGRPVLELTFTPRFPESNGDSISDRVLNRLAGTLWVDEEDGEMARVTVRLANRATLFGGILGSLEKLTLVLESRRVEPGVWLMAASTLDLAGRKVFSSLRLRARETYDEFRREPAPTER